jgi:hypothetical protein
MLGGILQLCYKAKLPGGGTMPEETLWHCLSCGRLLHASAIENPLLILHTRPGTGVFCPGEALELVSREEASDTVRHVRGGPRWI